MSGPLRLMGECYPPNMWFVEDEERTRTYHGKFVWMLREWTERLGGFTVNVVQPKNAVGNPGQASGKSKNI